MRDCSSSNCLCRSREWGVGVGVGRVERRWDSV